MIQLGSLVRRRARCRDRSQRKQRKGRARVAAEHARLQTLNAGVWSKFLHPITLAYRSTLGQASGHLGGNVNTWASSAYHLDVPASLSVVVSPGETLPLLHVFIANFPEYYTDSLTPFLLVEQQLSRYNQVLLCGSEGSHRRSLR